MMSVHWKVYWLVTRRPWVRVSPEPLKKVSFSVDFSVYTHHLFTKIYFSFICISLVKMKRVSASYIIELIDYKTKSVFVTYRLILFSPYLLGKAMIQLVHRIEILFLRREGWAILIILVILVIFLDEAFRWKLSLSLDFLGIITFWSLQAVPFSIASN